MIPKKDEIKELIGKCLPALYNLANRLWAKSQKELEIQVPGGKFIYVPDKL